MILRRITDAFRKQDWFTVFVETMIVVLGVFLGLQVNNWNEARRERDLGDAYRVRLIADLENDLSAARTQTSYYAAVTESIVTTDRLLASSDPDPQALVVAAYRASEFSTNPPSRATWDQIVSSGDLGFLSNAALEGGLSEYYRFQDTNDDTSARLQDTPYRRTVRSLIPLAVQISMRQGCSDVYDEKQVIVGFVTDCNLGVDPSMISETAQALTASADIRQWLRYQYSMVASVQVNNAGNVFQLEQLLDALAGEETAP